MPLLSSSAEIARAVAARLREARLRAELTQAGLAIRAGVSLASLRRFEATGNVSLATLAKLARALGHESHFDALFAPPPVTGLAALLSPPARRKRGSRT